MESVSVNKSVIAVKYVRTYIECFKIESDDWILLSIDESGLNFGVRKFIFAFIAGN